MNIVLLGPFGLHPKGTMRARALPAARALAARGHRVSVLMPPWQTPHAADREWRDEASEVDLTYVSLTGLSAPGLGHGLVAWRLARHAAMLGPDIVHAFKPKAYSGLAAGLLRARQRLGGRFALVMDTDDWEGAGGWNELEPYGPIMRRFFAWQEPWGIRHADAVTVASRALEAITWSLGVPSERVTYLPNAICIGPRAMGTAVPSGLSRTTGDGPPQLLLYTRFFDFALQRPLDVLARVRRQHPEARLVVAGRGLFGEEERFLALARDRGLGDAVEYRGWVEPAEAATLFARTDVALYPSDDTLVNRTRSSVKLLDLLAAGVPVVAEAVGENAHVIEDRRSGRLVPPGDVAAFAAAVSDTLADEDGRQDMGRAARERIDRDYRWDVRVETLLKVYDAARAAR